MDWKDRRLEGTKIIYNNVRKYTKINAMYQMFQENLKDVLLI